jgi:hypothetical protein
VINLCFPRVEFFLALCTDRAVSEKYFFSQVSLSWPVLTGVDVVEAKGAFTLDAFLFLFDFVFFCSEPAAPAAAAGAMALASPGCPLLHRSV